MRHESRHRKYLHDFRSTRQISRIEVSHEISDQRRATIVFVTLRGDVRRVLNHDILRIGKQLRRVRTLQPWGKWIKLAGKDEHRNIRILSSLGNRLGGIDLRRRLRPIETQAEHTGVQGYGV